MTISQSSVKQNLEKEPNFNQTIKMFEQNTGNSNTNHKNMRKSLIPTSVSQKNYYSKFPFEKIIETNSKKETATPNSKREVKETKRSSREKHSESSNSNNSSNIQTIKPIEQISSNHTNLHRQHHLMSPPAVTPRSGIKNNITPRQTLPVPPQRNQSPPIKTKQSLYNRHNLSPHGQTMATRVSPHLAQSQSPHPITPRSRSKVNNLQQTQQLHYHQQFSSPQTLNNRHVQPLHVKAPFKVPAIHKNNTNHNELRVKENDSRMRESRLDNHNLYDLNSDTILILPNKDKEKNEPVSQSPGRNSKLLVKKNKKSDALNSKNKTYQKSHPKHELGEIHSIRPEDLTDSSLSSESFIATKVETTQSLFELISFLKIYLKKLENNYSLDELYTFLKTNVKFNGYRNFTIELLERYAKPKYTSCLGVYNDTNATVEPQLQANNNLTPVRSLSQLKPSPNPPYNTSSRKTHKATKPVQKLLKNLNIFKTLFHIVQRDLVVNIFLLDIPKISQYEQNDGRSSRMTADEKIPGQKHQGQNSQNRVKLIQKIKRYHEILYDLNEKLSIMINDHRTCDLSILSQHSALQAKYLYYKHGEYVLRITTDIISKFKMILNICQSVYYLNSRLKENDYESTTPRINGSLTPGPNDEHMGDYDKEHNFYSVTENEQRKQYALLKQIPRKKAQAFQKLPTLQKPSESKTGNELNKNQVLSSIHSNGKPPVHIEIGQHTIKNAKKPPLETVKSLENGDDERRVANKVTPVEKEILREDLKEKLLRLDSNDSFIRETDSSSITSENDSVLCFIDDLEHESEMKNQALLNQHSLNNKTILPYTDSFQVQQDTNKLLEQHKVLTKQLDLSNQKCKELNFYLENLIERAERCNHLKLQLKTDQDLIRMTENNLKEYNRPELNIKQKLQGKSSANRKQLEKQQDFLAYRFNLNLQDLTLEMAGAPQINFEIGETEKKISNLHLIIRDLNKYKFYVESRLSKHLLNIQL